MAPAEPEGDLHAVLSPVAGVFYRIPEPGAGPYVETGDIVEAERGLCFVQTMESVREAVPDLHQVVAGVWGEVVEVLVEEAEDVEAGRALFRLRADEA